MKTRIALSLLLLAAPALPQGGDRPAAVTVAKQSDADQLFYRAFYLNRGERRYEEALVLYRQFLDAAPDSRYAARAVRDAVAILNRSGRADEAAQLRDRYSGGKTDAKTDAKADSKTGAKSDAQPDAPRQPADRGDRGDRGNRGARGGDAPAGDARPMTDEEKTRLKDRITDLKAQLAKAEESGDQRTVQRLGRQVQRAERQLESGVVSTRARGQRGQGGRGQGRGARQAMNFADMDKEQIAQRLQRMERFQSAALDRLRQNGQTDQADKLEKQWTQMKKLLDEGKTDEAQKIYDEVSSALRRRRQ